MKREDVPVIRHLAEFGPQDPVFDMLMLIGPVIIVLIPLVGRTTVTQLLAVAYIGAFLVYTASKALQSDSKNSP